MSHPDSMALYSSTSVTWKIKIKCCNHESPVFILNKQECKLIVNISSSDYSYDEYKIKNVCLNFTNSYTDYHNPKFIVSLYFSNKIELTFHLLSDAATNNDNTLFSANTIPQIITESLLSDDEYDVTAVILYRKSDYEISSFINHMKFMLQSELYSDFQIKAGDKIFNVHKAVITSRCNALKIMTESDMIEKKIGQLELQADPTVVQALLDYLYTSKCQISVAPTELFKLAHFLELEELQMHCKVFLLNNIDYKNIISILELTSYNDYNLKDLQDVAMKFVNKNESFLVSDLEFIQFLNDSIKLETITYILRLAYHYQIENCFKKVLEFVRLNYEKVLNDKELETYLMKNPDLTLKILRYSLNFFNTSCDKKE